MNSGRRIRQYVAAPETQGQNILSAAETDTNRGSGYTRCMSKNRPYRYPFREEDRPNRIYYWRKEMGLSLEQLGEAAGMSRQTLHKYETGRTPLTIEHMRAIAAGLGVAPADLLMPHDNPYAMSGIEREIFEAVRKVPPGRRKKLLESILPLTRLLADED